MDRAIPLAQLEMCRLRLCTKRGVSSPLPSSYMIDINTQGRGGGNGTLEMERVYSFNPEVRPGKMCVTQTFFHVSLG